MLKENHKVIKKPTRLVPLEAQEQEALIRWAQYYNFDDHNRKIHKISDYLFAIPNGGLRDKRTGRRLKLQGVKAGASDLFFAYPCNGKHGLFIEMKRQGTGKLTKAQQEFMEQCRSVGYASEVAYGWEEAVRIIEDYLKYSMIRTLKF